MTYRTKIDWWVVMLLGAGVLICFAGGIQWIVQAEHSLQIILGISAVIISLLVVAITCPTYYVLTSNLLKVRSGLFLWKIPLHTIEGCWFTSNPMSAPAWSLKRLRISYRKKNGKKTFVLVSPKHRNTFLHELARLTPSLELVGGQLIQKRAISS